MSGKKCIEIGIFNNEYMVFVSWYDWKKDRPALIKLFKTLGIDKTPPEAGSARAWTFFRKGLPVILLPSFPKTPALIGGLAHEATHAISHIFDYMSEKNTDHETFAASVGAVVRVTLESEQTNKFVERREVK